MLIGTMLLNANAFAADQTKQAGASKNAAALTTTDQTSTGKEVLKDDKASETNSDKQTKRLPYYAKVGAKTISWAEYNYTYTNAARNKFYHGKPKENDVAKFQREIGDKLVTDAMLVQEAKRRKLKPDSKFVKQEVAKFEQRFANDPNWPNSRPRVLPIMTKRFQDVSLRNTLEASVRNVPDPSINQLKKYYSEHPEKFTSPPQQRVSTILLRVDPGAPDAEWQGAIEQGQELVKRLRAGEDFAEMAREYSGDITAENGGDMGYLHEGMLPGLPAETVAKLQPGEISDPVTLMEGVAIFRLNERTQPKLNTYKEAQNRAKDLWLVEERERVWNSLIAKLHKNTPVEVDQSRFFPLPVESTIPAESNGTAKP